MEKLDVTFEIKKSQFNHVVVLMKKSTAKLVSRLHERTRDCESLDELGDIQNILIEFETRLELLINETFPSDLP